MRRFYGQWGVCALVAGAMLSAMAVPIDNLRSEYRNWAWADAFTNASGVVSTQVGIGSGYFSTNPEEAAAMPFVRSTIGSPISAIAANKLLGEVLTPPDNWSGEEPEILEGTGGRAVWIEFAHEVVTLQSGPIEINWPLKDGSTKTETHVVAASPSKRPVRLYWTHERPMTLTSTTYKSLQNAGPTVTFGQNYKVHLYGTGQIGIFDPTDPTCPYDHDDKRGWVYMNGGELQAFEGSYGTFLIAYSRLDERLNERILLAYEIVEVLEPKQTLIEVKIGDQLKPQTRSFSTEELFPKVTRGFVDEAENDEVYVYQHGTGKQKNYLWAIRDSSENPWKIEIFWRAKEELDVVWPFEVDIYGASWDTSGAQVYLRDTETAEGGEAKTAPAVYYPSGVTVEAMNYQVALNSFGQTVEKEHVHINNGILYTDWADAGTYALLRYSSGDAVWFQTIRSVPAKSVEMHEGHTALGEEIRAPFCEKEDDFFYPGWIQCDHTAAEPRDYPIKNPYNVEYYKYPTYYTPTNELRSQIFGVNIGELQVWWNEPSTLMGEPRPTGGNPDPLDAQIYFPTIPALYKVDTPEQVATWLQDGRDLPQIVLASGEGSAGYSLYDYLLPQEGEFGNILTYNVPMDAEVTGFTTRLAGVNRTIAEVETNFTFEVRLLRTNAAESVGEVEVPLISFYSSNEGEVASTPHLTLGYDDCGNFYLNHKNLTGYTEFPDEFAEFTAEFGDGFAAIDQGLHLAFVHTDAGEWHYYVNAKYVGTFPGEAALDIKNDSANIFETYDGVHYNGPIQYLRLWSEARKIKDIDLNRYRASGAKSALVFQYDGLTQPFDDEEDEEAVCGDILDGCLVDSSGHGANATRCFGAVYDTISTKGWVMAGWQNAAFRVPHAGRTFPNDAKIYRQNDRTLDGFNPNEEHALMISGVAHALRCDLNRCYAYSQGPESYTSLPYVLVEWSDPEHLGKNKMCALRVVPENDMYRFKRYLEAGQMIQSPDPLARLQPANMHKFMSGPRYANEKTCYKDRKGWFWAHQAGNDGGTTNYVFELSYPNQASFDYTDGKEHAVGEEVWWLATYRYRDDWYLREEQRNLDYVFPERPASDRLGTRIDYTYIVDWPADVPKLYVNDTLHEAKNGLPAVRGQLSALIVYQQAEANGGERSARLIDPETRQAGSLPVIPDTIRNYVDPRTAKRKFTDMPPYLRDRFVWNPTAFYDRTHDDTRELELTGKYINDATAGFQYAWLNMMDQRSLTILTDPDTMPGGNDPAWVEGMQSVPTETIELTDDVTPYTAVALTTTGKSAGYVTLAFNTSTNLGMVAKNEVITMSIIQIVPELYNGLLHVIQDENNPLEKQINLKYTSDFGGKPEKWEFEWQYCEDENGRSADVNDASKWLQLAGTCGKVGQPMLDWVTVGDAGVFGLSDHWVRCRYRSLDPEVIALVGDDWTPWCKPQLAEGWVKRVLKAINPFDQKLHDLLVNPVDTSLSMIQQAGKPYQGDVPLNMDALSEQGLLAIYETVLNEAKKLSINADYTATGSLSLTLQMAAGRIAELYTLLGNEAYADALNPTVDLGSDSGVDDSAESSIFPFMNQCENVLDEELALLRGRDLSADYENSWVAKIEPWNFPVYNRLQWNFTADIMGGQVAYVENYGIRDVCSPSDADDPTKPNGIIDVYDAANLYPQGHGDAWGHYLSALKGYYALLRHPNFGWKPQLEGILAGQTSITIGYLHEKRFAQAAELKAKVGEKIVSDTYRQNYQAGTEDTWLEAEDDVEWTDNDGNVYARAWGTDEWATRAHLGAYYDWVVVNGLLPTREDREGLIRMLDRESTKELSAIAASARRIQSTADYADAGLNPLGISNHAIPFDISPSEIDAGKTHFEQIRERAEKAVKVAKDVFDRVKGVSNKLRDQNASSDFQHMVDDEEAAINRRLIEIYGYPYDDDIGPGKTYPQGYDGPDIYHYYYIETYDLDGSGGINGAYRGVQQGNGSYGRYVDVPIDDYRLIVTNITGTFQAEIDESLADNGFLGNMITGAISWYQDKLEEVGAYMDPWSKYTGLSSENLELPVSVIDLGDDALDGKVDYTFSVAAWTNAAWVASYYVGPDGFTPKPADFHGQRTAEGECQIALNGYAALLAEIDVKATQLLSANEKLQGLIDELTALDYTTQMGYVTDAAKVEVENYVAACKHNAETVQTTLEALKELKDYIAQSGVEAFPKLSGMSFDLTSVGRAAVLAVESAANDWLNGQLDIQNMIIKKADDAVNELEEALKAQFDAWMANEDREKKIAAINEQTATVRAALAELEITFINANEKRMNYQRAVAEGQELQAERERLRIQWAADLSQTRYRNMMYQIMRNDELQRYNEAFELAAKYVFLAAKAYDYETGLLKSDSLNTAGSSFMGEIIRARALGRFAPDGTPLMGGSEGDPGLADILARMDANWSVLKGRLGFNNPQDDLDSFSLRRDLFGKLNGAEGDAAWRKVLADCWVDDLRTHPVFAQHCQPFDPMEAKEPGFVIPFRTMIAARMDLFGNDLGGGSTAYSSTYFATKLRAVGVWIEGPNAAATLPTRPEVYLIPAGLDYMRVPVQSSTSGSTTRSWTVVDQVLPVPYTLGDSNWESTNWSALKDIAANSLSETRRHPAIRASVGATFDENATMTYNARLIGRSVWNDQWYIFIPAASLNSENDRAKTNFLDTVKDIHLNLKTYSFSGN